LAAARRNGKTQGQKVLHKLQNVIRHIAQTEVMPRFLNTPSFRKEDGSMLSEADLAAQTAFAAAPSQSGTINLTISAS